MTRQPRFKPVGDSALLVELGNTADDTMHHAVVALDGAINNAKPDGVIETVPALVNVLVLFDPLVTDHGALETIIRSLFPIPETAARSSKTHVIPVCYDATLTPDLMTVAEAKGLTPDAVAKAHTSAPLRVSLFGFGPGIAYLSGLDPTIHVPRKPAPVRGVPKGSILIAGPQSIITTLIMPTGWSIIGRTSATIMDTTSDDPFLFGIGDEVRFERISRADLPAEMQEP